MKTKNSHLQTTQETDQNNSTACDMYYKKCMTKKIQKELYIPFKIKNR